MKSRPMCTLPSLSCFQEIVSKLIELLSGSLSTIIPLYVDDNGLCSDKLLEPTLKINVAKNFLRAGSRIFSFRITVHNMEILKIHHVPFYGP